MEYTVDHLIKVPLNPAGAEFVGRITLEPHDKWPIQFKVLPEQDLQDLLFVKWAYVADQETVVRLVAGEAGTRYYLVMQPLIASLKPALRVTMDLEFHAPPEEQKLPWTLISIVGIALVLLLLLRPAVLRGLSRASTP